VPKNRQYNRKTKYPDKVTKPKCLVFVRIFLFSSVGIKIQYFPTAPFFVEEKEKWLSDSKGKKPSDFSSK